MSKSPAHWRKLGAVALLLWPVSLLFGFISLCRRWCYRIGICKTQTSSIPVIVVGNISVGGTGKTPLTQSLVGLATKQGMRPGIVSRGHGGQPHQTPVTVDNNASASLVGDEPMLHHHVTGVPVVVCTDRAAAVSALAATDVDVAFSDDGLQHYKMQRQCEIAVVDGDAGFANGMLLPAGPLRESIKRLSGVDMIAVQMSASDTHPNTQALLKQLPQLQAAINAGVPVGSFYLKPKQLRQLWTGETKPLASMAGQQATAMAGIGAPQRFFTALRDAKLEIDPVTFSDHHAYSEQDFANVAAGPIVVTSKDAVKLKALKLQSFDIYELEVEVDISDSLKQSFNAALQALSKHRSS